MLSVAAGTPWTPYGDSSKPSIIFTIGPNGAVSTTVNSDVGPYDGDDDTYIGVVNNSRHSITNLKLTAPAPGNEFEGVFDFDEDGIQTYESKSPTSGLPPGYQVNGYEGPDNYFSDISADGTSGAINFIGGLAPGQQTYLSLEGAPEALDTGVDVQVTDDPSDIVPPAPTTFTGGVVTEPVVPTLSAPDRTAISLLLLQLQSTPPQKLPDGPGHGSVATKDGLTTRRATS